jgi:hypothetical protein
LIAGGIGGLNVKRTGKQNGQKEQEKQGLAFPVPFARFVSLDFP